MIVAAGFQPGPGFRLGARLLHDIVDQLVDRRLLHSRLVGRRPGFDHAVDLFVVDERSLDAARFDAVGTHEQHIAAPEQFFGAGLIHDHPRVGLGSGGKGHASGEVGLDQTGDHVDRRALGGHDEVDARGARELRQTHQLLLHFDRRGHHHIGQLVEYDDPVGQRLFGARPAVVRRDVARARRLE